jgi:hypothetical protein
VPSTLDFIESQNSCPGTQSLSGSGSDIEVFLFDSFGTLVTGLYLTESEVFVNMTTSGNAQVDTATGNFTVRVDATTGGAIFPQVVLRGHDNTTARLFFTAIAYDPTIPVISCSISLLGCPEGYGVQTGESFDTCEPSESMF